MEKGATRASQVIATEDTNGKITYKTGYGPQSKNASGPDEKCERATGCKTTPRLKPKQRSSALCKGKRAAGPNNACPLNPPKATPTSGKTPVPTTVKAPAKTPAANPKIRMCVGYSEGGLTLAGTVVSTQSVERKLPAL